MSVFWILICQSFLHISGSCFKLHSQLFFSFKDKKNIFACLKCGQGMLVFDDRNGFVKNLDHIAQFLDNHTNIEVMTFEEFKDLVRCF